MRKIIKLTVLICWVLLSIMLVGNLLFHFFLYAIDGTLAKLGSSIWLVTIGLTMIIAGSLVYLLSNKRVSY